MAQWSLIQYEAIMTRLTALVSIFCFLILTACGGGADSPAMTDTPTSVPAAPPPTIQLFGDSTMRMVSFPLIAQYGSRMTNRAVNGSSSTQLVTGTDGLNAPWPGSVTARYVIVNHGLNDGLPARRITLDAYRANLEVLASAPGAEVIFQTPMQSLMPGRDMTDYTATMREVAAARGLRVIDMFACFQAVPGWRSMLYDGTHPNAAGLDVMMACMRPTIDSLES